MLFRLKFIWVTVIMLYTAPLASTFNLTVGTPTECDDLAMSWTGGTSPFVLFMTPVFGTPRITNISTSAMNNGQGSFKTRVAFPANQKMLVTLFDSNNESVTSDILTVGNSLGGSCNTTDPGIDFSFQLNTALQQCRPYTFSGYSGASQPVLIYGFIPLGDTVILQPPTHSTTFDWVVNVQAGTSMVFVMMDSASRNGGSSDIKQVGISSDNSCLDNSSPSSTASPTSTSFTSTPTGAAAPSSSTSSASHGLSIGVIIGAGLGGLILIATLVGLIFFFVRKPDSHHHVRADIDLSYEPTRAALNSYPYPVSSSTNLTHPDHSLSHHFVPSVQQEPRPFIIPPPVPDAQPLTYPHSRHSISNSQSDLLSPEFGEQSGSSSSSMSTAQRKAALAGATSYKPSRFILHTDVDETPHEEEIIELPPQYSDNRRPLQLVDPYDPTSPPPSNTPHSPF